MEEQNNNIENQTQETPETIVPEQPPQETPVVSSESEPKSTGSIVGAIIIIIIIILGGFYLWSQKSNQQAIETELTEEIVPETADIEADLEALDTIELDMELENIDIELGL